MPHRATSSIREIRPAEGAGGYTEIEGTWAESDSAEESGSNDFAGLGFSEAGWHETTTPSTPRSGVRRLRKHFTTHAAAGRRWWLVVDALPVDTSVWLDGAYLGDAERGVLSRLFDVTNAIEKRDEHLLALQLGSGSAPGESAVPTHVRLIDTGAVCITRLKVLCTDAASDHATVEISAEFDANKACEVTLRTAVSGHGEPIEIARKLTAGRNRIRWSATVDDPSLWHPKGYGPQNTVNVVVSVHDNHGGPNASDSREVTAGLRSVSRSGSKLAINGTTVPIRALEVDADTDLDQLPTGANSLLVNEKMINEALLNGADRHGLIVLAAASNDPRRARESAEAFGHHPSLVAWRLGRPHVGSIRMGNQGQAARAVSKADPSRPVAPPLTHVGSVEELDELRKSKSRSGVSMSATAAGACHLVRVLTEFRRERRDKDHQFVDVHIINDGPEDIDDGVVSLALADADGVSLLQRSWSGSAESGDVTYVGTLEIDRLGAGQKVALEVSLIARGISVARTVTQSTGSDGMILGVTTKSGPKGLALKARRFKQNVTGKVKAPHVLSRTDPADVGPGDERHK